MLGLEVLVGTYAVAALVRERKTYQLTSVMQTGRKEGMQTLDDAIMKLVREGTVTPEEAAAYLANRDPLGGAMRAQQPNAQAQAPPRAEAA